MSSYYYRPPPSPSPPPPVPPLNDLDPTFAYGVAVVVVIALAAFLICKYCSESSEPEAPLEVSLVEEGAGSFGVEPL
jgi:hypothetical protein